MNALLVHPRFPVTYWGFQYGLPLAGRKSSLPPLGLMSLAALLPRSMSLRLVDANVRPVTDVDLAWADVVLVGGMHIQAPDMHRTLSRAKRFGRRTIVGGPACTTDPEAFEDADVVFAGEAEGRIDDLVAAMEGRGPHYLPPGDAADMTTVPPPRYDLIDPRNYASMSLQYSRGCPYRCEFCDIIEIFGRVPRTKTPEQVLAEMEALLATGYRGSLFFVDDNFIGNRPKVRKLLPHVQAWQQARGYPFEIYTEASVNLASDEALLEGMADAGFSSVFLGIETPSAESLAASQKTQNLKLDLMTAVETISRKGIEVMSGFIVGFDTDGPDAFDAQLRFIGSSPIPLAMVGLLTALPSTQLWRRLEKEGRLRCDWSGDQFGRPNFEPVMDESRLLTGYARLLAELYEPDAWYDRCERFLDLAPPPRHKAARSRDVKTLLRTTARVGLGRPSSRRYRQIVRRAALEAPGYLPFVISHAIMGEHMTRYTREDVWPRLSRALAQVRAEQDGQVQRPGVPRVAPKSVRPSKLVPIAAHLS